MGVAAAADLGRVLSDTSIQHGHCALRAVVRRLLRVSLLLCTLPCWPKRRMLASDRQRPQQLPVSSRAVGCPPRRSLLDIDVMPRVPGPVHGLAHTARSHGRSLEAGRPRELTCGTSYSVVSAPFESSFAVTSLFSGAGRFF